MGLGRSFNVPTHKRRAVNSCWNGGNKSGNVNQCQVLSIGGKLVLLVTEKPIAKLADVGIMSIAETKVSL